MAGKRARSRQSYEAFLRRGPRREAGTPRGRSGAPSLRLLVCTVVSGPTFDYLGAPVYIAHPVQLALAKARWSVALPLTCWAGDADRAVAAAPVISRSLRVSGTQAR
jgi:hypothetical protein